MTSHVSKEQSACAACKFQKKKCSEKCLLAPYFPHNDPDRFLLIHRVFGYGHVVKLLKDLPAEQRGDAVSSLVYEARARAADPVHGCVAVINNLLKKIEEVQLQLVSTHEKLDINISVLHGNLYTQFTGSCEGWDPDLYSASPQESEEAQYYSNPAVLDDDIVCTLQLWERFLSRL